MLGSPDRKILALLLFTMWGFAVAQPIYDQLGRHPTFLVAQEAGAETIVLFTAILSLGLPTLLVALALTAGLLHRLLPPALLSVLIIVLAAVTALPPLKTIELLSDTAILGSAIITGILFFILYLRNPGLRTLCTLCSPAVLFFPVMFLFFSPVRQLLLTGEISDQQSTVPRNPVPIVLVVFDEFSSIHLVDDFGRIDAQRYPNFAALGSDAYWFPNATTVADVSHVSVPAILTGSYYQKLGERDKIPILADYPSNLFTLFENAYRLNIYEELTRLAPAGDEKSEKPAALVITSMLGDLAIVYGHIVYPEKLALSLPDISQGWGQFNQNLSDDIKTDVETFLKTMEKERSDISKIGARIKPFRKFLDSIRNTAQPSLNFVHLEMPHSPYEYLPSGRRYNRHPITGLERGRYKSATDARLGLQRYLLQVGYTDTLLGELLEKLRAEGLYDSSLIIVTADHGVSFRPNVHRRTVEKQSMGEVMPVPLLVKLPNQEEGTVIDRWVETIDILPTIADITRTTLPWATDGVSLFTKIPPERASATINRNWSTEENASFRHEDLSAEMAHAHQRMLNWFGTGTSRPDSLWTVGPHPRLLGMETDEDFSPEPRDFTVTIAQQLFLQNVEMSRDIYPGLISGTVTANDEGKSLPTELAIAINDTIRATTWISDTGEFAAMLPEAAYRQGRNTVEAFLVLRQPGSELSFLRSVNETNSYRLAGDNLVRQEDNKQIPVVPGAVQGHMVEFTIHKKFYTANTWGWAANVEQGRPADEIIIMLNGESIIAEKPTVNRPDVGERFGNDNLTRSGIVLSLPREIIDRANTVRVYARSGDIASELVYGSGSNEASRKDGTDKLSR